MRISDWSSDVCSSDLGDGHHRRLAIGPPMMSIALRRLGSAIALWALASKSWEVTCMLMGLPPSVFLADGGRIGHAGQHLGDMAHLYAAALALQLAGHVEQAAHDIRRPSGRERVGQYGSI